MSDDGWTEERASYRSENLPAFLRLSRLMRTLEDAARLERIDRDTLASDLVSIALHLSHGTPLPGQPVQMPPASGEVR